MTVDINEVAANLVQEGRLSVVYSRTNIGINALLVTIETHISPGLPRFNIVGLPDTAIKESKERVRSAILTAGFTFPSQRLTVNLAPADLPKDGGKFDLAIAIGILAASGQLPVQPLIDYEFTAELALNGDLRAVTGILPVAVASAAAKRQLIVASANAEEAALPKQAQVLPAAHLLDVAAHLHQTKPLPIQPATKTNNTNANHLDLTDIIGQETAKRALLIAAAGQHSLLLYGPPGTGKTMLASRLPTLLPELNEAQMLAVAAIRSISQSIPITQQWLVRPFRAPHHTASSVALVGGGNPPKPGEISLAHHGVLFLDELPEFSRHVLEALREPLESGIVTISRATRQAQFPARFQLIAAMNPCPCGYHGDPDQDCHCTHEQIARYHQRLSGPLLDRIDLYVPVARVPTRQLQRKPSITTTSAEFRKRVQHAREQQAKRSLTTNALLSTKEIEQYCPLTDTDHEFLISTLEQLKLSMRAYHRILRVARTIADLELSDTIERQHLLESLGFRQFALR